MNSDKKTAVVVLSGGMDSATLLYHYLDEGYDVKAVSFNYGQRHSKELSYAEKLCKFAEVEHKIINLPITEVLLGSSQTDKTIEVPEGHYAAENMKKTVVPNRNMIMISIAGAWAISLKADVVAYGAHAGDHTIYPDCRDTFVIPMSHALRNADWHQVQLEAPFLFLSKGEIAEMGVRLKVPFELTWTCYKGLSKHCGKCGACQERKEAFVVAGIKDPTEYSEEENVDTQKAV